MLIRSMRNIRAPLYQYASTPSPTHKSHSITLLRAHLRSHHVQYYCTVTLDAELAWTGYWRKRDHGLCQAGPHGPEGVAHCLGCMTFGDSAWSEWVLDEDKSRPLIRKALDLGTNTFDMADM